MYPRNSTIFSGQIFLQNTPGRLSVNCLLGILTQNVYWFFIYWLDLRAKNVQSNSLQLVWSPCEKIRQDDSIEYIVQQLHQENSKDVSEVCF